MSGGEYSIRIPDSTSTPPSSLQLSSNSLIHRLSKVANIARVQPRHRDTPAPRHVDVAPLDDRLALFRVQARVTNHTTQLVASHRASNEHLIPEHADLVDNVVPVPGCLQLLRQQRVQRLSHVNDAVRHRPHVPFPLIEQRRVVEYQLDLMGAISPYTNNFRARRHRLTRRAPCEGGFEISDRCRTDN